MNSQPGYIPKAWTKKDLASCQFPCRLLVLGCLLALATGLLSGCASVKQYSVDSWQGPMPLHDLTYVTGDM